MRKLLILALAVGAVTAVPAQAGSGVATKLTLKSITDYGSDYGFFGKLKTSDSACEKRKVVVVSKDGDKESTTSRYGQWAIETTKFSLTDDVFVKTKTVHGSGNSDVLCKGDKTKTYNVGDEIQPG
jgi:hypothetical protein